MFMPQSVCIVLTQPVIVSCTLPTFLSIPRAKTYICMPLHHPDQLSTNIVFLERSLHLFSRCGDGRFLKSLVAALTRDPSGHPRDAAAALIASCCAVLFVYF